MTYAAYLRAYEPVSAFHEPDRSRWAAYAVLPDRERGLAALRNLPPAAEGAVPEPQRAAGDQSAAEIRAAIDGAARGECELAMYMRARSRRRASAGFEPAN